MDYDSPHLFWRNPCSVLTRNRPVAISPFGMSYDAALLVAGVVSWTLAEYVVHRFVLHGLVITQHGLHHANPDAAVLIIFWQIWACFALIYLIAGGAFLRAA